jgi:alpha-1,3-glucan synthase
MTEWPTKIQVNVWGMNPDGKPDQTWVYGDVDNDTILDRSTPGLLAENLVHLTALPRSPFLAYQVELNDATLKLKLVPTGSRTVQVVLFILLWTIPVLTGAISIWTYMGAFYKVKFNASGIVQKTKIVIPFTSSWKFQKLQDQDEDIMLLPLQLSKTASSTAKAIPTISVSSARRTVLIATMEYDIEDWAIKIKIGGLGVMAQLMGKSLTHQVRMPVFEEVLSA